MKGFNLIAVEFGKYGGLTVQYTEVTDDGVSEFKTTQGRIPHPDLTALFESKREFVTDALGFVVLDEERETHNVRIAGVKFNEDSAEFTCYAPSPFGPYKVKSPKIPLDIEEFDGWRELVQSEVFEYLNGKSAELQIFGE